MVRIDFQNTTGLVIAAGAGGGRIDSLSLVDADGNRLVGTTSTLDSFVFYNVVFGNLGNGLRITNSDHTVVHANFFGLGANNVTRVEPHPRLPRRRQPGQRHRAGG